MRFISGHNNATHRQTHGRKRTPEYGSYRAAKERCRIPTNPRWEDYGGRGIEFRFTSFEQFIAELGPRPTGMTLDRKNNDGHYEPGNVRWATSSQQNQNQRSRRKQTSKPSGGALPPQEKENTHDHAAA